MLLRVDATQAVLVRASACLVRLGNPLRPAALPSINATASTIWFNSTGTYREKGCRVREALNCMSQTPA